MNDYMSGRWKPAWLVSYIQEKAQREAQASTSSVNCSSAVTNMATSIQNSHEVHGHQAGLPAGQEGQAEPPQDEMADPVWDQWRCSSWPTVEGDEDCKPEKEEEALHHTESEEGTSWTWSSWTRSSWTWSAWVDWTEEESPHGWQSEQVNTWQDWTPDPIHGGSWPGWGDLSNGGSTWTTSSTTVLPNAGLFPEVRSLTTGPEGTAIDEGTGDLAGFMQLTGAERRRMQENGVKAIEARNHAGPFSVQKKDYNVWTRCSKSWDDE